MTSGGATPYDDIPYPGHPYETTHPDRLTTIGALFGMNPVPASRCRVLELGCGIGGNLIPMAYQYPESSFTGIDLSRSEIEKGLETVASVGLQNISLRHADIGDVTEAWGQFDYIIAHGVYSWVPPAIRQAMLAIFSKNLSPQGIAYVSYNAHPGSHLRDLVRDIMNYHVHDLKEPKQRIGQARAILKFVSESSDEKSVHGAVLRDQFARVLKMHDEVLFHDDLNVGSTAFLLHQVVADAQQHGLQYLCDASLSRRDLAKYPEAVRDVLGRFPDDEFLARDQFQDFIDGFGFRRTLLCHGDIKLRRKLEPELLSRFYLSSSARPVDPAMDPNAEGVAEFKIDTGAILATDHRLSKAAMLELGRQSPGAVAYDDLIARALARTGSPVDSAGQRDEDIEAARHALFTAAMRGHIELHTERPAISASVSERPEASRLARMQAERRHLITNLQHTGVLLEDERVRRLLMLVDGTRDLDTLVADLKAATADIQPGPDDKPIDRTSVEAHLKTLAGLALLVR
jgi:SAM-dependent methyltransferase